MHTIFRNKLWQGALLLVIVALLGLGLRQGNALAAWGDSAAMVPAAATLPTSPCTSPAPGASVCDLWATTGSASFPDGTSVTIWGYSDVSGGPASLPGPVLIVNQDDLVTVTMTNTLAETTALLFGGQDMIPDTTGVAPSATKVYTFTASRPGTFLYQASLLANAEHQVAMGMYGALVVRPTTAGQAYSAASSAFDDEALVVLSEMDLALNANPAAFDMRNYKPKYFLINGKAFPATDPIDTLAGHKVLLRYVNAGLQAHSMSLLGMSQVAIAMDGSPYLYVHGMVAETIAPGQTADVIATVPALAATGSKFALYDGTLSLHNNKANNTAGGFGGMLTFVTVGTPPPPGADTTGPATAALALVPNPTNGSVDVALSATVSDVASGGSNVDAAEYFIDTLGASGAGTAMGGTFGSPTASVNATLTIAQLGTLASGNHTIYVHGHDAAGNWGPFNHISLNLDKVGPATNGINLVPDPSNGSVDVSLTATGDDRAAGNSNVTAAEYWIDSGPATTMTVNTAAPVASLSATIPAATVSALSEGSHVVSVRSQDALGNWGAPATAGLTVDKTGPTTGGVTAVPNPNNGTLGFNSSTAAVRVTATFTDTRSSVSSAEGFIDTVGASGTGFLFIASDGVFNTLIESGYVDIPLATINALAQGTHTLSVHAKDWAGNWGAMTTITLVIDKTKPVVSNLSYSPNPTNSSAAPYTSNVSFTLSASASDPIASGVNSSIVRAEWYEGADPGAGNGNSMSASDGAFNSPTEAVSASINFVALGWARGNHTLYVRARDAAGNWSTSVSIVVNIVMPNAIFADSFESGNVSAWNGGATGAGVSVTTAARMTATGTYGMQVVLAPNTTGYVTDLMPLADPSYHARFYFSPNGSLTGNNNVVTILDGLNAANTSIFQVQFRRQNAGNGTYQMRLSVLRAGGTTVTNWYTISNAAQSIEIAWQSGTTASASLYIDGALQQTLTGLNTSAYLLDTVRMGPSAGLVAGATGTMYLDAFASTRNTVIGP